MRQITFQIVNRGDEIGNATAIIAILRLFAPRPEHPHHRIGRIGKLAGTGDQIDAGDPVLQLHAIAHRAEYLEGQIWNPVAEFIERQVLEHHIGRAAKRRRLTALNRLDQGIGQLVFSAGMKPHRQRGRVEQRPIGPDAPDAGNLALAQPDRETDRIAVIHLARPAALAAA